MVFGAVVDKERERAKRKCIVGFTYPSEASDP